jgi:hypothetical protein
MKQRVKRREPSVTERDQPRPVDIRLRPARVGARHRRSANGFLSVESLRCVARTS